MAEASPSRVIKVDKRRATRGGLVGGFMTGPPQEATVTDDWEAVLWDIGGVLLDLDSVADVQRAFVAGLVDEYDLDRPVEEALATWREATGAHFRAREGTEFRAAREAYARGVAAVLGEPPPDDAWREQFLRAGAEHRRPVAGAVETVETLSGADLHLGVVSDVDAAEGERILRGFGVREQFDAVTTSEEVGRTKPDPAMFETALEKAGSAPGRTLMVGDRYEHDVAGAAALGIRTAALGVEARPELDYPLDDVREVLDVLGVEDGE